MGQIRDVQAVLFEKLTEAVSLDPRKLCRRRESPFGAHQSKKKCTLEGIDRALFCGLKVAKGIAIECFVKTRRIIRVYGQFVARTSFSSDILAGDGMSFCQVRQSFGQVF